jgi:hypothetical protein
MGHIEGCVSESTSVYLLRFAESILRVNGLIESKTESVSSGKRVVLSSMFGEVADGDAGAVLK